MHFLLSSIAIPSSQFSRPALTPSQHYVTQIEGVDGSPPVQYQPTTSPEQSDLHFEVLEVSPSSQTSSGVTTFESPHTVLQVEIDPTDPEHCQPSSGPEQSNLHFLPSSNVIPSSQISDPSQIPSQQIGEHVEGLLESPPVHVHPKMFPVHVELQRSEFDYPPSSQNSSGVITLLSPQTVLQVEIYPIDPEHDHPSSSPEQSNLHFQKSSKFTPSSQASVPARIPSPH